MKIIRLHCKDRAFSLIELMVVVAIVAALAAVAVPAYKNYIEKAKYGLAYKGLSDIQADAIRYNQKNGSGPSTVAQIGLTPDGTDPTWTPTNVASVNEFPVQPYIAAVTVNSTAAAPGQCASVASTAYIPYVGETFTSLNDLHFYVLVIQSLEVNGTFNTTCFYYNAGAADGIVPFPAGCVSGQAPEYQNYVDTVTAWNAQCP